MRNLFKCLSIGLLLGLGGCASVLSHSSYPISFNSHPSGESFRVSDREGREVYSGKTPATVMLNAGEGYFKRAFYSVECGSGKSKMIETVEFGIDPLYFGNILLGGFLGLLVVDPLTGAMYAPISTSVDFNLKDG